MDNDLSLLPASALARTPPHKLQEKTLENAKLINRLEQLIQAERFELGRLLADQTVLNKRPRLNSTPISKPYRASTASPRPVASHPPNPTALSTLSPYPAEQLKHSDLESSSPRGIMYSFSGSISPSNSSCDRPASSSAQADDDNQDNTSQRPEMAARGSHWSFIEKARFEAAVLKYGSFAWDDIIKAVGTRTEKQVKAYAARYRRRKKLAARMQALPIMTYPEYAAHSGRSFKPSTNPPLSHKALLAACARHQTTMAEPSVSHYYPVHVHLGEQREKTATAEPAISTEAMPSVRSNGTWEEAPSLGLNQSQPSVSATVLPQGSGVEFTFAQESKNINLRVPTSESPAKTLKQDLVCDVLLEVPEGQNNEILGMPSEVDLLVDQAIGGTELNQSNAEKPLVMQLDEDAYAQELADGWFDN